MKNTPPRPPGWNLTIADLMAEMNAGKRKSLDGPEVEWAREYERSLIPVDTRFPRQGDVYEALHDAPVHFMTAWSAPFTGGGESVLKAGDKVLVDQMPHDPKAISVYAVALDYSAMETRVVPESERTSPKYAGFYFSLKTVDLNRDFKLVQEGYGKMAKG
jgi:hypothetical protein